MIASRPPLIALALLAAPVGAQSLPASPASSTEKPGKEETAPEKDDTGLIITASSRARYETVAGRPRPGYATAEDAFELRTGLAIEYGPGPLAVGGELIDSRAYGLVPTTQINRDDVNAVELPQLYLKLKLDGGVGPFSKLGAEGGRFLLNFGASRLVGTDEYRNTVNGFTGARLDLSVGADSETTLFYVLPQERLPDDEPSIRRNKVVFDRETWDDVLFGVHYQRKKLVGEGQLELLWLRLAEHDSPGRATADRRLQTLDARLSQEPKPGKGDYDVEGAYQFGHASASTTAGVPFQRVSAGFAHAAAGYTWDAPLKPRVGLFYDWVSGDRPGGTFGRFDTLFGSRREDFGPSGTYAALARENISAPGIRFEAKPGTRFEFLTDYRGVWLASRYDRFYNVTDPTGRSGDFAGQQVEGRVRFWIVPKHLRLETNYAVLFKGGFLRDAPAALDRADPTVRLAEVNLQVTF